MRRTIAGAFEAIGVAVLLLIGQAADAQTASGGESEQQGGGAESSGGGQGMMGNQGGGMQGQGMQGGQMGQGMQGMRQGMRSQPHLMGSVASVNPSQREIALQNGRELKLAPQAEIVEHGERRISFDELKPGDRVRASFDQQGRVDRIVVIRGRAGAGTAPIQKRQTPGPGRPAPQPSGSPAPSGQ